MSHAPTDLTVVCLCAAWCGTCRDYRAGFSALARQHGDAAFHWVDIEDEADWLDDLDVENFPTLLVLRAGHVLFFGPMLPQHALLDRLLASLRTVDAATYAGATPERQSWQALRTLAPFLARQPRC